MLARRVGSDFLIYACLIASICGCATQRATDAPTPAGPAIKKIAIIPITNPRQFEVDKRGGPLAFLPGGGVWRELETSGKSSAFTRKMRNLGFTNIGETLTVKLKESLEKYGYEIVLLSTKKVRIDIEHPDDIANEKIETDADAILNVWVEVVGAFSLFSSTVYRPQLNVGVKLMGVGPTGEKFYGDSIVYGAHAGKNDDNEIVSDKKYAYQNYDALMERAPEVIESLQIGIDALAARIAANLAPFKH
jgi:hypothetical protein